MPQSPIVHPTATFTATEQLERFERVYALGTSVRKASESELETGVVSRRTESGVPAAVEIAVSGNKITLLAATAIAGDSDVFRAANGRVAATGTSRIGRALHSADTGAPVQIIYEPGGAGGDVTIEGAMFAGDYNPTTNTPALTDASGVDQTSYKVVVPTAEQTRDFGSGDITFPANTGGELRHTGGIWRFYPHKVDAATAGVTQVSDQVQTVVDRDAPGNAVTLIGYRRKVLDNQCVYEWNGSTFLLTECSSKALATELASYVVSSLEVGQSVKITDELKEVVWSTDNGWMQEQQRP